MKIVVHKFLSSNQDGKINLNDLYKKFENDYENQVNFINFCFYINRIN